MDYANIFPFWKHLSEAEKDSIKDAIYTEVYDKKKTMYQSHENCKGLITVLSGQLRSYIISDEGREVTLFRVYSKDVCVLSASCLMDTIDFEVLVEAFEGTKVLVIPSVCLNKIMKSNPYMELYLYKTATEKFSEVMWTMQQILFRKIDQRVAQFLWDEMLRTDKMTLQITHDEIAKYIGSAREVVTKILKYLSNQQVIALKRGEILILNKEKLKSIVM